MIFIKKMAVLGLTLSVLSSTVIPSISSVYVLADEVDSIEQIDELDTVEQINEEILYDNGTFEETSLLPEAPSSDFIGPNLKSFKSAKRPNSIADYKALGYTNFSYSKWTGDKNVLSSKSKRVASEIVKYLLGKIPGVNIAIDAYDLTSSMKTQYPDIWPTSNLRNIMAKTPAGYEARIGQESIIKYYSNSKRTKLVKTIQKTHWVG